jgi:CubicO group peptidase (beta-lactamase class C family)
MRIKKIILRTLLLIVLLIVGYAVYYGWVSFPIISGFGAKDLCSCVFVSGRPEADVVKEELGDFPLTLGSYTVNYEDSSVTGTVWGMAKRKAIYRPGIGCTVINDIDEKAVRAQVFAIPPVPVLNTDTIAWPMGDRLADTVPAGLNKALLDSAVSKAFEEPYPDKKVRTRAVVILYDGQLVAERYATGYDQYTKMLGWSMAKSVTATLAGILVQQGKLNPAAPAPVTAWNNAADPRHAITLQNLLQQQSGLDFKEDYSGASDVTNMLYKRGDMAGFTAGHSLKYPPGTVFSYSSGNSNLISYIIRQATGESYASFPATALFYKTGMYHMILEPDASGTFVGSSYVFASARDFARFGLLYYNDGVSNNGRLLPEGWVKATMTAPATNVQQKYGYQFWLNGFTDSTSKRRIFPGMPADLYYADGYAYQGIYIIPSRKLVVVRLGLTLDNSFDVNAFLNNVLAAVPR